MADKIKGITLQIGGDTAPLDKALKNVNKTANSLQGEIKAVDKALKLDPTNTELLTQKQKLLGDAVEGARAKVDALKAAKKSADEDMANGTEVNERQYRNLQREIVNAESNLKSLEKQAKRAGDTLSASLERAGGKVKEVGSKISDAGKSMLPVTGAIVGVGTAAIAAMDNVDDGLDTVMKKTGATGEAAKELDRIYRDVASTIPAEFGDIGAAVGEINTRLDFTGDKLRTASIDFLKFAKVNDIDVNTAVQKVTRAMGDAGIAADDYGPLLDQLTVASQKSGISIDSLTENLAKYGAPMRALGIDTKDAIAMFAGWEKAGVNTEIAFSGMKKAISNWGAAGKDSTVEFKKAMDQIKAAPDIADATSKAIEIFGAKAGPDLADAIRGGRFEFETYTDALQNAGGAVNGTYGMIVDEVDDAALAMQNIQLAMHDVGETIAKTLGPMLLELANRVKALFEWFGNLDSGTQKTILAILAAVAAIGPLLMIIGQLTMGFGSLMMGLAKIGPALANIGGMVSKLGALIMANPVVAVIVAIIAAIVLLWNNCEWFRDAVTAVWETIKETVSTFAETLVTFFTETIPNAWNSVIAFFQNIPAFFEGLWQSIKQFFQNGWNGIAVFFTQSVPTFIASIGAWFAKLPYNIGFALGTAIKTIANWGISIFSWVTNTLPQIISNIVNWFAQLPERVGEWLTQTVQRIAAWGARMLASAQTAASTAINAVVTFFSGLPEKVWTWLISTVAKVGEWGANMVASVKSKMSEFVTQATTTLSELPGKVLTIGENIVKGVWNGIANMASWVKDKIAGWCGSFVDGFKKALGIHSPSAVFRDLVGKNIVLGIDKGITQNEKKVIKTAGELSQHILSEATKWVDDKKFFNEMALSEELAFWEDLKAMEGLQGTELHEIDKKIFTAKQNLITEQRAAEEAAMQQQQAEFDEYQRNIESRADALRGFAGIFDEVSRDSDLTGEQLLKNLKGQVKAFEDWQADLDQLAQRGLSADVIAELREQGPKAVNEIGALTQLDDDKLAEYSEMYARKTMLATQQAINEMGGLSIPIESIADVVGNLNQNASYAITPTAQFLPVVDETEREKKLFNVVAEALVAGLAMVGDSIFDAIPKQAVFNVGGTDLARATWDAYDAEGSRRRRYYAPTREDIASIAMSVVPRPLKG